MNPILSKYKDIRPINDIEATNSLLIILTQMTSEQQQKFWIKSGKVGFVCLFEHESRPGVVLEYVQGSQEDSVTTLYQANRFMGERQRLMDVRQELIDEIGRVLMALPSTVAVFDAGRDRQAMLNELGTAQLIDVLAHFTHTDLATA